jgi:hypothetical protein
MKELLTFNGLFTNPAGKGSAHLARRDQIIDNLKTRCAQAIIKHPPEIAVYTEDKGYIILFSIPSEEYPIYYDVVLRFSTDSEEEKSSRVISEYNVTFFSNAPNFNYTYAHVLNQDGWLIPELVKKLSTTGLTEKPEVRNPSLLFGFEKSVYFALLIMKEYNLTSKTVLTKYADGKANWKSIVKSTKSFDEKMDEYNKAKAKVIKTNADAKKKEKAKIKTKGGSINKQRRAARAK